MDGKGNGENFSFGRNWGKKFRIRNVQRKGIVGIVRGKILLQSMVKKSFCAKNFANSTEYYYFHLRLVPQAFVKYFRSMRS